jgi:hypothetical protein
VVHLDRPAAVFEVMLEGWATQQRGERWDSVSHRMHAMWTAARTN